MWIEKDLSYLSKFHHHVSEDVQEADHSVPQPAVGQRLLVPSAGTLRDTHDVERESRSGRSGSNEVSHHPPKEAAESESGL